MSKNKYSFYMQECDKYGNLINPITRKNLEDDFLGMRYSSMSGIESFGKPKNIYVETFADSNRDNVYIPNDITLESTKIVFTCYFIGDSRFDSYYDFTEYIQKGFHRYWDNARNRYFVFYSNNETKVESFSWQSTPYLKVQYSLTNVYGRTFELNESQQ